MTHHKLISFLIHLSHEERIDLKKYILSKTSNASENFQLITYLINQKEKLEAIFDVERIGKKLFGDIKQKALLNYFATLFSWAEEWAVMQQIEKEKYTKNVLLVKWYNAQGNYHLANLLSNKVEKEIDLSTPHSLNKIRAKSDLLFGQHFSNNPIKNERGVELLETLIENYLHEIQSYLNIFFLEMNNWGAIKKYDFDAMKDKVNKLRCRLPESQLDNYFSELSKVVLKNDVEAIKHIMSILKSKEFENDDLLFAIFYEYCYNYSVKSLNKGLVKDSSLMNEIINFGLDCGHYSNNGKIPTPQFQNLVMAVANYSKKDTALQFVNEWIDKVDTKNKDATKSINLGIIAYANHEFDDLMKYMWRSDFESDQQNITARIYHAVGAFMKRKEIPELYDSIITNLFLLIKRNKNKMSENNYNSRINLLDFMKKYHEGNFSEINLNNYKNLACRSWCEYVMNLK